VFFPDLYASLNSTDDLKETLESALDEDITFESELDAIKAEEYALWETITTPEADESETITTPEADESETITAPEAMINAFKVFFGADSIVWAITGDTYAGRYAKKNYLGDNFVESGFATKYDGRYNLMVPDESIFGRVADETYNSVHLHDSRKQLSKFRFIKYKITPAGCDMDPITEGDTITSTLTGNVEVSSKPMVYPVFGMRFTDNAMSAEDKSVTDAAHLTLKQKRYTRRKIISPSFKA